MLWLGLDIFWKNCLDFQPTETYLSVANIIAGGAGKWQKHIEAINQLAMVDVILAHSPSMVGKVVQHSFFWLSKPPKQSKPVRWGSLKKWKRNGVSSLHSLHWWFSVSCLFGTNQFACCWFYSQWYAHPTVYSHSIPIKQLFCFRIIVRESCIFSNSGYHTVDCLSLYIWLCSFINKQLIVDLYNNS